MAPVFSVLFSILLATQAQAAGATENLIIAAAQQAETELNACVGLAIHDTGSGTRWQYNADERFPMTSTFKVLACGALLARQDVGDEDLNRQVPISQSDLVTYSPVTETWVGQADFLTDPRFGNRRISHQVGLADWHLPFQVFIANILPRKQCPACQHLEGTGHGEPLISIVLPAVSAAGIVNSQTNTCIQLCLGLLCRCNNRIFCSSRRLCLGGQEDGKQD
nr:classA [uncultured bacterium]